MPIERGETEIQGARNLLSQRTQSRVRSEVAGTIQRARELRSNADQLREQCIVLRNEYYKWRELTARILPNFLPTNKLHK